jgi:uncharacterized protein (DUF433 family)
MNHIEINPNKSDGKPVIKGTRFTVAQLLLELEYRNARQIAEDFGLDREHVIGALIDLADAINKGALDGSVHLQ